MQVRKDGLDVCSGLLSDGIPQSRNKQNGRNSPFSSDPCIVHMIGRAIPGLTGKSDRTRKELSHEKSQCA